MLRRRFYAPPDAFSAPQVGATVVLAPEEARHLRDVLRLRTGDEAFVFDGEGNEFFCVIVESGRGGGSATLAVRERVPPQCPESPLRLTLAVALLKGEKFDLVVQKATELGAAHIVPVSTKRADVRLRDASDAARRTVRWQRLALEAAKQSGRARVPLVAAPVPFASVIGEGVGGSEEIRLMFAERGGGHLPETVGGLRVRPAAALALVGPEGGWEEEEITQARDAGWSVVTLGGRTLRAETAAITVAVLLQHLFGDLA